MNEQAHPSLPRLGLIWAQARGRVIGRGGALPWHLPEDLAHFKRTTAGCPVIMGRRTWDSLPARFRPLPGRQNIVLTRRSDWAADGAQRAASLEEALQLACGAPRAWVIGGAQLYAHAIARADQLCITEIDLDVEGGDAFAPALGHEWREVERSTHTAASGLHYSLVRLVRTPPPATTP
ncbi:MAG: dihydrofolate reductase [Ottowia sp.]|nr:dihydrofolate reductase [Ottowia sp.]